MFQNHVGHQFCCIKFLEQKRNWIEKFLKMRPKIKLQDGDTIVIFGEKMIISQKELGADQNSLNVDYAIK